MRKINSTEISAYKEATDTDPPEAWIIVSWLPFKKYGWTCFKLIFVVNAADIPVICHELKHVDQFVNDPWLFHIKYLIELTRVGLTNNHYEVEARLVQRLVADTK